MAVAEVGGPCKCIAKAGSFALGIFETASVRLFLGKPLVQRMNNLDLEKYKKRLQYLAGFKRFYENTAK
jgi:hypothetical protein